MIGDVIRACRTAKKLTQEQLGEILGVTGQAVSKWETNDNIPDTAMLVPISKALGVSTDKLLGNNEINKRELYSNLTRFIVETPDNKIPSQIFELIWRMQCGWFGGDGGNAPIEGSTVIEKDNGFMFGSLRSELPFFTLCVEPENGFGSVLKYDENYRRIFEALGDADVLKAFMYLYSVDRSFTFEKEVLGKCCGIADDRLDEVMEKLSLLGLEKMPVEINGVVHTVYTCRCHSPIPVSILAMLNEFVYSYKDFHMQSSMRNKPYFI